MLVLCYHAVSPTWPAELSVTPDHLEAQIEHLSRHGYRGVTFSDAVLGRAGRKTVAITFDDGYASTINLARPILERFGMPATAFVPTDYMGGGPMSWPGIDQWVGGEHEHELMPMTWNEIRELADAGWEIGSHTKTHPHLNEIEPDRLDEELGESRRVCEENLDRPCRSLAYPYGDYDERVIEAAQRTGYEAAGTLPARTPKPSPLAWPRVGIYYHDGMGIFRVKVSGTVQRMRSTSAWRPIVTPLRKLSGRARS
jgi:peptidoglycan/xylan/chitin deacetylase (PgdA/CDA1 family)